MLHRNAHLITDDLFDTLLYTYVVNKRIILFSSHTHTCIWFDCLVLDHKHLDISIYNLRCYQKPPIKLVYTILYCFNNNIIRVTVWCNLISRRTDKMYFGYVFFDAVKIYSHRITLGIPIKCVLCIRYHILKEQLCELLLLKTNN